ncbi:MAG TPA: hypothetical protein VMW75_25315 [Thermoanaerobaculia bacterium]|nr:hypothetical protein [Thermoanaerobaculia bacterium]
MESRCPKCGFERLPQASECPVCGVVFAKLERAAQLQLAPSAAPRPRQQQAPPPTAAGAAPPATAAPAARQAAAEAPSVDPYAAPRSTRIVGGPAFPGFGEPRGGCWRSERLVVMERGAELPDRCVRCNAPAQARITKTLYWHSPWLYLLLVAWLLYVVTALLVRKRARIAAPLCDRHLKRRRKAITASWVALLVGIAAFFVAGTGGTELAWLYMVGFFGLLGGLVGAVFAHRVLLAKRIDDRHVWLRGAASEFLNGLPAGPSLL